MPRDSRKEGSSSRGWKLPVVVAVVVVAVVAAGASAYFSLTGGGDDDVEKPQGMSVQDLDTSGGPVELSPKIGTQPPQPQSDQ
jgi:hypothetical protein